MNKLSLEKRTQIIHLLVEGNSMRSTSRIADVSINTVTKLLVEVGKACMDFHEGMVHSIETRRIQCDEIWSFVYAKQKNVPDGMEGEAGDIWTWTAIDADTKLIVSWLVGNRDADTAEMFMRDVASMIKSRIQLTTDGLRLYMSAVSEAFGWAVDYAQLVKMHGGDAEGTAERKYSPSDFVGIKKTTISGKPEKKYISTSFVERQNLTMRMHMRRFTRLTNGFSKKIENHNYAIALHFVYYNL